MPQTDFFANKGDVDDLVHFILNLRFFIVPLMRYQNRQVLRVTKLETFQSVAAQKDLLIGPFLLIRLDENIWPLKIEEIQGTTGHFFCISERKGGPSLSFDCWQPYQKEGVQWITESEVSFFATYQNTLTGQYEKIPETLRSKYHEIVRYIKKSGIKIKQKCIDGGMRDYWILPGAFEAMKKGARLGAYPTPICSYNQEKQELVVHHWKDES